MNRFERHPVLTLAAVVVLALVALLAALEALLAELESGQIVLAGENALAPPRFVRLREYQPDTTFTFAPPAARLATPGGPVAPSYTIATDVDGFIAPSRVHALADLTIAFLGGSTTETMFVAPENRFPFLVGRLLEQRLGIRVNSLNAAKSGNNTLHSIIVLTAKLLPLRPDFVLLTHNMNDLGVLATYGSYWNDSKDYAPVVQSAHGIEAAFRGLRDALIPRTYRAVKRLVRRPAPPAAAPAAAAAPTIAPDRFAAWGRDFESALRQYVASARAWHVRPILMTQVYLGPDGWHMPADDDGSDYFAPERLRQRGLTPQTLVAAHAHFNAIIRAVAAAEGIDLIDVDRAGPWTVADIYDGVHYNDAGSRRVAALIASALEAIIRREVAAGRLALMLPGP